MKKIHFLLKLTLLLCSFTALAQPKYVIFDEEGKQGLVDLQGKTVLAPVEHLGKYNNFFITFNQGISTIYNQNLKVVFRGKYDEVKFGLQGNYIVKKNQKYGVVTANNQIVIPFKYDEIYNLANGYKVTLNEKEGVVNNKGKLIIPLKYEDISQQNNCYKATLDGKEGILSLDNKTLIPFMYQQLQLDNFNTETLIVAKNEENKVGFINTKNEWVISPIYRLASPFQNGLAFVRDEQKKSMLINTKGEVVIKGFDVLEYYNSNIIVVRDYRWNYSVYNYKGELLDVYNSFYENHYGEQVHQVSKQGKYGFIDGNNKVIIPLEYEGANELREGLIPVIKNDKWGCINFKNEIVIPFQFIGSLGVFENGVAVYSKGPESKMGYSWSQCGLINNKGEVIVEPKYKRIEYLAGNIAIITIGNDKYLYDFVKDKKLKRLTPDDLINSVEIGASD
nr:WG repeat-containing protein [uncultured Capnocytophaga sp.]